MLWSWKMLWTSKAQWVVPPSKVWHYHIYGVWVFPNVKVFNKPRLLTDKNHVNYLPWIHTSVTQNTWCIIFLLFVATIYHLNYGGRECTTRDLQCTFLTHLWPWNKVSHQTYNENANPKQGCNHTKFETSCFNGVQEIANVTFFVILVFCSLVCVRLLQTLKSLCTIWFVLFWCVFKGDN